MIPGASYMRKGTPESCCQELAKEQILPFQPAGSGGIDEHEKEPEVEDDRWHAFCLCRTEIIPELSHRNSPVTRQWRSVRCNFV